MESERNPQLASAAVNPVDPAAIESPINLPDAWPASEEQQSDPAQSLPEWVEWLVDTYWLDRRVVPHCWQSHSALQQELEALHLAHTHAYDPFTRADYPLAWHAAFNGSLDRLRDWTSTTGCKPGVHVEHDR